MPLLDTLRPLANCLRALSIDAVEAAQSGHPGMPLGMADVATVLYARHLKFYPHNPHWADRDRVVFSGGHGSMLLYALNHLTGYGPMTMEEIKRFRQLGSRTPGHPERDVDAGIEVTTGPLGQGIGMAVGLAMAERNMRARFTPQLVDHRTYVLCGDGDLQEGISHEACALAGHLRLDNLVMLYDDNGITIDGPTELSFSEDVGARFRAYGWATTQVNGHEMDEIDAALNWAKVQDRPALIICKTTIGYGAPTKAGTAEVHGSPLGAAEAAATKQFLGWTFPPFEIPDGLLSKWLAVGERNRVAYTQWEERLAAQEDAVRQAFIDGQAGLDIGTVGRALTPLLQKFYTEVPNIATRKASQLVIEALAPALPNLIGGSADLTGSNLTKAKNATPMTAAPTEGGTYIHYGVREFGMGTIMNGIAAHGGLLLFGGTFLCFTDYLRPALRLSALMHLPVIYVMTHDSIGLGEDGPTHQPVEHLSALRAMPNVRVFRPADAIETLQCWYAALAHTSGPSVICLSRQNTPALPRKELPKLETNGAMWEVVAPTATADTTLIATGTEVAIAVEAAKLITAKGPQVRVISAPCWAPGMVMWLPTDGSRRVAIEAGVRHGWDSVIGADGVFIGLDGFGASGKASDLYAHFGLTPEGVADQVLAAFLGLGQC
jgi:transketolase